MPKDNSAKNAEKTAYDGHENTGELERLKHLLEISQDSVWEWNVQTKKIYSSSELLNALGYQENEIPLSHELWYSLIHPEDLIHINKVLDEYNQGSRESHEIEYRMQAKSGEWRWILSRARLVKRDKAGKPLRMIGMHRDITKRKHEEEALQESLAREIEKIKVFRKEINTRFLRISGNSYYNRL